ncbi:OFA family MFS transporter [Vibrio sp.]|nr:OFA family MFS transporter [Vibrio sp.]
MTLNKPLKILISGFLINLCIGVMYAWSVFHETLIADMGWSQTEASSPYAVAILTFSVSLLVAGILQDKLGPRKVVLAGVALTGLGMIASGYATSVMELNITYGIMMGLGCGFSYACLCPSAMKWFHPSKKGTVNGTINAGFGLSAMFYAPLISYLIGEFDLSTTFQIVGVMILILALPLAATFNNPPKGYVAETPKNYKAPLAADSQGDMTWKEMIKTPHFYLMCGMNMFAAAVGLMLISNITSMATEQTGVEGLVYLASILALFNSAGRVLGGMLLDKIGGINTLTLAFIAQAVNLAMFPMFDSEIAMIIGTTVAALSYGTLYAGFPSLMANFYGLKNYGTNYGVFNISWGISGSIGPAIVAFSLAEVNNYDYAYMIGAGMMAVCVVFAQLARFVTKPKQESEKALTTA